MDKPTIKNLECLIHWPEGTIGYRKEYQLLKKLLTMCEEHGFGRMAQLAQQTEDIWRNPERQQDYEKVAILVRERLKGE